MLHCGLAPVSLEQPLLQSRKGSVNLLMTCHSTWTACYQLTQSALKIVCVLAERVGQGEVDRSRHMYRAHGGCLGWP